MVQRESEVKVRGEIQTVANERIFKPIKETGLATIVRV